MSDTDPRIPGDHLRRFSGGDDGAVTLVGVVHDHPASKHRVRSVLGSVAPDVLALELPPLAIPLFEEYATDERTPPAFGGEMSAAIQAAPTDRVAAIDGPSPTFTVRLLRRLGREKASFGTVKRALGGLGSVSKHAIVCRAAATVASLSSLRVEVDAPVPHDADWTDDAERQAADEREQVRTAQAVLDAFEPARANRFRDETREAHMVDRLSALREEGDVVAVVGIDHLDAVASGLRANG